MYFEGLNLSQVIILVAAFIVYFMPWYVAILRDHHRRFMIGLLNLLLGWTLIGWLIAFLWATSKTKVGYEQAGHEQEEAEQAHDIEGQGRVDSTTGHKYSQAS